MFNSLVGNWCTGKIQHKAHSWISMCEFNAIFIFVYLIYENSSLYFRLFTAQSALQRKKEKNKHKNIINPKNK